jgi:hypothetical protein
MVALAKVHLPRSAEAIALGTALSATEMAMIDATERKLDQLSVKRIPGSAYLAALFSVDRSTVYRALAS